MCGYSMMSYPRSEPTPLAVIVAVTDASPGRTRPPGAGAIVNFTLASSSSRESVTGTLAGSTRQPAGARSATVPAATPFWLLCTVTRISRRLAVNEDEDDDDDGMTAISGAVRTLNAGTTSISIRFSPAITSL